MPHLRITITQFIDPDQPGWVACTFSDAYGTLHTFHEKVPVVTQAPLDENSTYPQEGAVACTLISERDATGRSIVTIDTAKPWGIASVEGSSLFEIFGDQLTDV